MRAEGLLVLYVVVGFGCAAAVVAHWRRMRARPIDLLILLPFWPLYGPILLLRERTGASGPGAVASLPPITGDARLEDLGPRIQIAQARVEQIDRLLALPDFSEQVAQQRHADLQARGDHRAAATAQGRVDSIRRLRGLRDQFAAELTQVDELMRQLRVQSEVIRFAGAAEQGTDDLVLELLARVEGLDAMLAMEPRVGPSDLVAPEPS